MEKLNPKSIVMISKTSFSSLRIQDGICPFFEKPSDEHNTLDYDLESCEERITAIDLFSHFTADVIKEKVIFTR